VEVERLRSYKRENIMRPLKKDSAITIGRISAIAIEPSTRGDSVAARRSISVRTCRLDRSDARGKPRPPRGAVSSHNKRGTQAVAENAFGVVGKYLLNLDNGIATLVSIMSSARSLRCKWSASTKTGAAAQTAGVSGVVFRFRVIVVMVEAFLQLPSPGRRLQPI